MNKEYMEELNKKTALKNGNGSAFPVSSAYGSFRGLSKREYIATQIFSSLVSNGYGDEMIGRAVDFTDKLLIELHRDHDKK